MSNLNRILSIALGVQLVAIVGMSFANKEDVSIKKVTVLEGFSPEKVTRIEVYGAKKKKDDATAPKPESVVMAKEGTKWVLADLDAYPCESARVGDLLTQLSKMTSMGSVLTKSTYHEKLEVAESAYQRKVVLTHDGKPTTLYFGTSPSFKNIHVRRDGSDDVFLVNNVSSSDLGERAWNWVNRDYLKHSPNDVWALKLMNEKGVIELEKKVEDSSWYALGNDKPLKKTAIDEIVRKAGNMTLEVPVGKATKPEYGFEKPLATVMMRTGTSTVSGTAPTNVQEVTLTIGAKIEGESRYYAKASSSEYVVKVAQHAVQPLIEKAMADLYDTGEPPPMPKKKAH